MVRKKNFLFFEHRLSAGSSAGAQCSGKEDTAYMEKLRYWGLGGHRHNTLSIVPSMTVWAAAVGLTSAAALHLTGSAVEPSLCPFCSGCWDAPSTFVPNCSSFPQA